MKLSFLLSLCLWSFTAIAQIPDYVPTDGLVGWWPFNGNANDESGNGNNGVVSGAILTEDRNGEPNKAYRFDGVNDYISSTDFIPENPEQITVSIWFNALLLGPSENYIIDKSIDLNPGEVNRNWGIRINGTSGLIGLEIRVNNSYQYTTSSQSIATETWNHLVFIFDGSTAKISCNNIDFISVQNAGILTPSNYPLSIGYFPHANMPPYGYFWNGNLDDVGIWNRALTEEEIEQLYLAEITEGCTNIAACNFNPDAGVDDGSCLYPTEFYDCSGTCLNDFDADGICDELEIAGCTYPSAGNYNPNATNDDGSCLFACLGDLNNDATINTNDLLVLLTVFGQNCP
jgi:hypothetical protein